jgi:hypothetical protein
MRRAEIGIAGFLVLAFFGVSQADAHRFDAIYAFGDSYNQRNLH